jgi:hypothetical protein
VDNCPTKYFTKLSIAVYSQPEEGNPQTLSALAKLFNVVSTKLLIPSGPEFLKRL